MKNYTGLSALGRNLRSIRKSAKMTQKQVAEKLGISTGTLSVIENGKDASLDSYKKVANYFDIKVEDYLVKPPTKQSFLARTWTRIKKFFLWT